MIRTWKSQLGAACLAMVGGWLFTEMAQAQGIVEPEGMPVLRQRGRRVDAFAPAYMQRWTVARTMVGPVPPSAIHETGPVLWAKVVAVDPPVVGSSPVETKTAGSGKKWDPSSGSKEARPARMMTIESHPAPRKLEMPVSSPTAATTKISTTTAKPIVAHATSGKTGDSVKPAVVKQPVVVAKPTVITTAPEKVQQPVQRVSGAQRYNDIQYLESLKRKWEQSQPTESKPEVVNAAHSDSRQPTQNPVKKTPRTVKLDGPTVKRITGEGQATVDE